MKMAPNFLLKQFFFALIIIVISVSLEHCHVRVDALVDLRSSFLKYNDTTDEVFSLEDVQNFIINWKLVFTGLFLVVGISCYTLLQRIRKLCSQKQWLLYAFIIFTPCDFAFEAWVKLYHQNLTGMKAILLEAISELFAAAGLISFWLLLKGLARDQPVTTAKGLQIGAYQYVAVRAGYSVILMSLQHFGIYQKSLCDAIHGIVFISECISIVSITRYGLFLEAHQVAQMFYFYKGLKGTLWAQGLIVKHFLSSGVLPILYGLTILEMVAVSFLQHHFYHLRGVRTD